MQSIKGKIVEERRGKTVVETSVGRVIVDPRKVKIENGVRTPSRVTAKVSKRSSGAIELDLHHCTVADVEPLLSKFLDDASVRGEHRLKIIHGKGSGKLRREVERLLSSSSLVSRYESAQPRDGSTGVTVAFLQ